LNHPAWEIFCLTVTTAWCLTTPGLFLVLRKSAMVGDAMSHVLLFGIVLAFLLVRDLDSAWLAVGAAGSAVLVVFGLDLLERGGKLRTDAALGLIFPTLFSLGVLGSTLFFRNTHLDVDQILLGQVEFAPPGAAVPQGLFALGGLAIILLFWKELQFTTFDSQQAALAGFRPAWVRRGLMLLTAIMLVRGFDAVGPVLSTGFLVLPVLTAGLFSRRVAPMLAWSLLIATFGSGIGVTVAFWQGTNVAGMVALVLGCGFLLGVAAQRLRGR